MEAIGLWIIAHLPEIIFAGLAGYSTFRTWKANRDKKAALREVGAAENAIDVLTAAIEYARSAEAKAWVDRITHDGPATDAGAPIDRSIERNRLGDANVQQLLESGDLDKIADYLKAGKPVENGQ